MNEEAPEPFGELVDQIEHEAEAATDLWVLELMKEKVDSLRSTLENRILALKEQA